MGWGSFWRAALAAIARQSMVIQGSMTEGAGGGALLLFLGRAAAAEERLGLAGGISTEDFFSFRAFFAFGSSKTPAS